LEVFTVVIDKLGSATSSRLAAIAATGTIQAAARAFADLNTGLLVVCDEAGRAAGVLSKSDLIRHLAGGGPVGAPLAPAMSRNIVHCAPEDDLYAVWQGMLARRLQNMPVLDADSRPLGVLDIRDALQALLEEEQCQEQVLVNYISGVGYR
jgi:CBS domain-containing protein